MTDLSRDTSNCCGEKPIPETDICSRCKEHADFMSENSIRHAEERALRDWREDNPRNPYKAGTPEFRAYQNKAEYLFKTFEEGLTFIGGNNEFRG